ncbi:hypothetical protein [Nocardia inohanensis]|uniref:hypothetical protein n=1 Tax=Nocardia inohanensis TaxID=209246 RepID=UPI000835D433|nr:hypothetical protein [Nocardia inohanensis]
MSGDDDKIEFQVLVDVLDAVEARLRDHERYGWRLTVPRTQIYATVLHAVILSARATRIFPTTLDRAEILDAIFDGIDAPESCTGRRPIDDAISGHIMNAN